MRILGLAIVVGLLASSYANAGIFPNYPVSGRVSGSSVTPGGVSGSLQYNSGGTFAGDNAAVTNGAGLLSVSGVSATGTVSASAVYVAANVNVNSISFPGGFPTQKCLTASCQILVQGSDGNRGINIRLGNNANNTNVIMGYDTSGLTPISGVGLQVLTNVRLGGSANAIGGSFTPSSTLDISGTIRVTGSNIACTSSLVGAERDVVSLKTKARCDGTNWFAYASTSTVISAATP